MNVVSIQEEYEIILYVPKDFERGSPNKAPKNSNIVFHARRIWYYTVHSQGFEPDSPNKVYKNLNLVPHTRRIWDYTTHPLGFEPGSLSKKKLILYYQTKPLGVNLLRYSSTTCSPKIYDLLMWLIYYFILVTNLSKRNTNETYNLCVFFFYEVIFRLTIYVYCFFYSTNQMSSSFSAKFGSHVGTLLFSYVDETITHILVFLKSIRGFLNC